MPSYSYKLMPRYSELGGGHVSNTVMPVWFEEARFHLYDDIQALTAPDAVFGIVRRATYDYGREIFHGSEVEIVSSVAHIGQSSATFYQEAWQGGFKAVVAEVVLVMVNGKQGGKIPLSAASREYLEKFIDS